MFSAKNITGGPITTLLGLMAAMAQAGITAAAQQCSTTGNTTDWVPYAAVAANAAIVVLVTALLPDPQKPAAVPDVTVIEVPDTTTVTQPDPAVTTPAVPSVNDVLAQMAVHAAMKVISDKLDIPIPPKFTSPDATKEQVEQVSAP